MKSIKIYLLHFIAFLLVSLTTNNGSIEQYILINVCVVSFGIIAVLDIISISFKLLSND